MGKVLDFNKKQPKIIPTQELVNKLKLMPHPDHDSILHTICTISNNLALLETTLVSILNQSYEKQYIFDGPIARELMEKHTTILSFHENEKVSVTLVDAKTLKPIPPVKHTQNITPENIVPENINPNNI